MNYPVRVINNRIKMNKNIPILLSEGAPVNNKRPGKRIFLYEIFLLITLVAVMLAVFYYSITMVGLPLADIITEERRLASVLREYNDLTPEIPLSRLLHAHGITIIHRMDLGMTQTVLTLNSYDVPLEVFLNIISQTSGVFSFQYSQEGFQIFLAGGSI